jgi:hypothetical protein
VITPSFDDDCLIMIIEHAKRKKVLTGFLLCFSLFFSRAFFSLSYPVPPGPEMNTIVYGVRVAVASNEWIRIRSNDPERHGKFVPLEIRGEKMFRPCADPITGAPPSSSSSSSAAGVRRLATASGAVAPINMRTITGSLYDSARNVARYPHTLGPVEMADR